MTVVKDIDLDQILALPAEERIAIVDAIWASLDDEPTLPTPDWHLSLLAERLAEHDANPSEGISWTELRSRLERRECSK